MLMKKALLVALALGLICWAVPAMAVDWMVIGGFTVKSDVYKNVDLRSPVYMGGVPGSFRITGSEPVYPGFTTSPGGLLALLAAEPSLEDPAWNRTSWFVQMRGDIYVIAKASEDLKGVFGIEVNSRRFGDADSTYIPYYPGQNGNQGAAGRWNADAIAVQVKSMYIDFKVPMIPLWFKVGIQPFQLRNPVFLYADGAGVWGSLKLDFDPVLLKINPFWAKIWGTPALAGTQPGTGLPNQAFVPTDWTTADDANFFGVDINATIGGFKPGVFFAMQRLGHLYEMPAGVPNPLIGATPGGDGWSNMWWLGAYLDATIGPVSFTGDFIYNGGNEGVTSGWINVNDPASPFHGTNNIGYFTHQGIRHEAVIARGVASYKMNKLTFGLGALFGTGDNPTTVGKDEGYHVPMNSEAAFFNDDFVVLTGDWGLRQPFGTDNVGGLFKPWSNVGAGVWYVRAFADYQVLDWLKLKGNVGYIGDTVSHGDVFSTSAVFFRTFGANVVQPLEEGGDSIGWELDAGVQVNIYKNLFWDSAFGYLIGGKALLQQWGGYRAQDPWMLTTVLTYQF
jgi:hypothetical protein